MILSCTKTMNKKELNGFIDNEENGLTEIKKIGSYAIQISYKPKPLIKRVEKSDNKEYFLLTISDNGEEILTRYAKNKSVLKKLSDELNFYMTNNLCLKINGKKIKALSCFHQATYGMTDKTSILVSFSLPNIDNDVEEIEIVLNEFGLGIGEQIFTIDYNKIKELTNINLSEDEQTT